MEITITELSHYFQEECVLSDIGCCIPSGQVTSIIGRSGSGKSTLLNIIAGLESISSGAVLFNGQARPSHLKIGYMTQKDLLLPFKTVLGNLELVCLLQKQERKSSLEKIHHLLQQFGLQEYSHKYPRELSGGIRQRVHLLRQFLVDSPLLLLDEPFVALDIVTKEKVQSILQQHTQETKKTTLLVTHDIKEALLFSDHLLILGGQPTTVVQTFDLSKIPFSIQTLEEEIFSILRSFYD